ncbi:MAG: hypothetical protein ACK47F_05930 [Flavobacteriales bacterium]
MRRDNVIEINKYPTVHIRHTNLIVMGRIHQEYSVRRIWIDPVNNSLFIECCNIDAHAFNDR